MAERKMTGWAWAWGMIALAGLVPEVFVIGDAAAPGKISRCIGDAVELALKI